MTALNTTTKPGVNSPPVVGHAAQSAGPDSTMAAPHVVILDDEPSLHRVLGGMMHLHGFAALHATNLSQFKSLTEREHVQAFVLDMNLDRGQSGAEALAWLRLQPQHARTPVIFVTGLVEITQEQQRMFDQHGAQIFHKGQSLQPLMEMLKRMIAEAARSSLADTNRPSRHPMR